jgi:hypothetical protein
MLSKKRLLIISGVLSLLLVIVDRIGNYQLCGVLYDELEVRGCAGFLIGIEVSILLPTFAFFLFALITYFMREEVFRAWARFAVPAVLVSIVLAYLTPTDVGGGFGPQLSFGKGDTALIMSILFVLISIIIIIAVSSFRQKTAQN